MANRGPAQSDPGKSWWLTLPGVLTALAAVITAITGLVVAVRPSSSAPENRPSLEDNRGTNASAATAEPATSQPAHSTTASAPAPQAARPLPRPSPSSVKLAQGEVTLDFLAARLEPYNATTRSLVVSVRFTNNGPYPKNFWADSFRLVVDGVPRAPTNSLNEVVNGRAAKEGDAVFEVPAGTTAATLRLYIGGEQTDVPLDLR